MYCNEPFKLEKIDSKQRKTKTQLPQVMKWSGKKQYCYKKVREFQKTLAVATMNK